MNRFVNDGTPGFCSSCPKSPSSVALERFEHGWSVLDLLGREVIPLHSAEAHATLKRQVLLVTGAAGSIGSELCKQLLDYEPKLLVALDINETGLFDLAESLRSHPQGDRLQICINDITNLKSMERLFVEKRPAIVFHAAAYKHVPLLENHPEQAIQTNALATYRLCCLAQEYEVARFVFISSDKAIEPVNVMGASKRVGEMIVQAMAQAMPQAANRKTRFCAVRFGNVIGSRGSVVPLFARQIGTGGPLTVTDPEATRYFMAIPEACGLVILAAVMADPGGLYILDMGKPVRVVDLALKMIHLSGLRVEEDIAIVYTGLRPGERLHEPLVAAGEELIHSTHSKIFKVAHRQDLPGLPTIAQWMESLTTRLQYESNAQLRERLFEIVQTRELIAQADVAGTPAVCLRA